MAEVTREIFDAIKKSNAPFEKFKVVSDSMEPLIKIGDKVVVQINGKVKRFDVVAFWGGDKLICHVLWHINQVRNAPQMLVTCPLDGRSPDLAIRQEDLLGPVLNFKLSLWQKLKLSWLLKSKGR